MLQSSMSANTRARMIVLALIPWLWFALRDLGSWMEVVAIALPVIGIAAAIGAAALSVLGRSRSIQVLLVSTVAMSLTAIVAPRIPTSAAESSSDLTIVSANLTGNNPRADEAVDPLLGIDADIVVLLEANADVASRYSDIQQELPYVLSSPIVIWSQVAVFSRYEVSQITVPGELDNDRIVAMWVDAPVPFTLVAGHLPRPWFVETPSDLTPSKRQSYEVELAKWLATLDDPLVLAGDLNSTDRGIGYRTLIEGADLVDAMRVRWAATTSTKWWPLLLRIDHILVRGLCPVSSSTLALEGSDHRAVVAQLADCG